jgi:hypothetical protein
MRSSTLAFRLAGAVFLAGLTGGCMVAIPPAIVIASYVIDVGSLVATGKTATDHALSAVAQQDCAVMRIFEGRLCIDEPDYQLADAGVLEPLSDGDSSPPLVITPLADGNLAALPQVVALPDARLHRTSGQFASGTITRDSVLAGATYLVEGLTYATLPDNGG